MFPAKNRRDFLAQSLTGVSGVWLSTHWPALLSAAEHAQQAAASAAPAKLEFFSAGQAVEIEAVSARIIPTTDTPGAREAGVLYFIDRALVTFSKDDQKVYTAGLTELQTRVAKLFPGTTKFSAATPEQQDKVLQSLDAQSAGSQYSIFGPGDAASSFFETIRVHTVMGFLIDPDSDRRGNRDAVGWKVIGRDPAHMFQPPFGFYDKDYPGYQPDPPASEKAGS